MQESIAVTISAAEAASYLGMSYWLLLQLVKRKEIKCSRVGLGRGNLRFRKLTLDEWLNKKEEESVRKFEVSNIRKIN